MVLNRGNPARHGVAAGSELFVLGSGNGSEFSPSLIELQQRFLASRFGVRPDRARLLAGLAFNSGRRG
ncbi:hypothetical protein SAMN05444581_12714 [Methylocapsa palsarum]|uniref:Uncharacterized protein n=1 Tax=Methylocapsa palsarum TaxID=1612308 RepID=A0A1I4CSX1_9HYPH|nr:hypothetical protein SAMN05444581_12714 [Methylocapsa palsarum]